MQQSHKTMFPLGRFLRNFGCISSVRTMASRKNQLVGVSVDDEGIATMSLQRLPVNAFNLEFLSEISNALDEIENNKYKAMILTSDSKSVFSAGMDLDEFYQPDMKRISAFWIALQEVWMKLFGSNYITAAAVNGLALTGGCLLASSCEYRAMVSGRGHKIGLNETAMGFKVPFWVAETFCQTMTLKHAELALTEAKMFSAEEGVEVGLIDDIALDKDDAIEKCKKFIKRFDNISPAARSATKQVMRAGTLNKLRDLKTRQEDVEAFVENILNPDLQATLGKIKLNISSRARSFG